MKNTILLVDDDKDVLSILSSTLEDEKYTVLTCDSGIEALDILKEKGEEICLIITDEKMPKMSGMEFLKETFYKYPYIIRVILTAYKDASVLLDAINSGKIYKFIIKPWDMHDLKITIERGIELFNVKKDQRALKAKLVEKDLELEKIMEEMRCLRKQLSKNDDKTDSK